MSQASQLVRDEPQEDSQSRYQRATQIEIIDVREVDGASFPRIPEEVSIYEIDAVNEDGETRENIVVVPSMLFENTKDVQYRHEFGIVGKYSMALAMSNDEVFDQLMEAIDQKREEVQSEIRRLKEKDSRLLHVQADLGGV